MIQIILIILLSVAGSAGGIWAGYMVSQQKQEAAIADPAHSAHAQVEFLTPELFVVPLVSGASVKGYFVCRLVFVVDPSSPAPASVSEDTLLADQFYSVSFMSKFYNPAAGAIPDVAGLIDTLLGNLNEASGNSRYKRAYIQQIDLFNRDEVRQKVVEERFDEAN